MNIILETFLSRDAIFYNQSSNKLQEDNHLRHRTKMRYVHQAHNQTYITSLIHSGFNILTFTNSKR
uniref:Uncharacterized protein n=1 Tax=Rhizophora mucronata TaxID=61149 RepID=A0A2P2QBU8_RHIMU